MRNFLLIIKLGIFISLIYSCEKNSAINTLPPTASFTHEKNPELPIIASFVDLSTLTSGTITSYYWNFGDGNTSTLANPVHLYNSTGTFLITHAITDNLGNSDTITQTLGVSLRRAGANFAVSLAPSSYKVDFTNNSTNADSYKWIFGDGTTSNSDSNIITHHYSPGIYSVNLIATSNTVSDTVSAIINIP